MTTMLDRLGEGVETRTGASGDTADRRLRRADIQGLRALAVVVVVLYHCGVPFITGGFVGVDVFFVISGFLITGQLLNEFVETGHISLTGFYARRARRLLPPALLVILVTVVLARVFGPVLQASRTAVDGLITIIYGMNFRLAAEGIDYQQANAALSPLQHFWSLAVEEQFYLVWPVCLVVLGLLTRCAAPRVRRSVFGLAVLGISAVSLMISIRLTMTNPPLAYYSLETRAWELGIGAMLAVGLPLIVRMKRTFAAAVTWLGAGMIVISIFAYSASTAFPGSAALLPVLGAAMVIGGGAAGPPHGVERILRGRPTQLIGNVSYGWYLWHWPAIVLGPSLYGHEFTVVDKLAICVLAFWLSVLTYLVLERPLPRVGIPVARWLAIGLGLSLLVGAGTGTALALHPDVQGSGAIVAAIDVNVQGYGQLRKALTVGTPAVPVNLAPALDKASLDVPRTSGDGCHVGFLEVAQPSHCVFGDVSAKRTILLFGDSHAEQWFGGLDLIAREAHFRLVSWTKVACPLADTVLKNEQIGRSYTECGIWRAQRLAAIRTLAPDIIVASQADGLPGGNYDNKRWAAETAKTLHQLATMTPDLVYLKDTPHPPADVPSCVAAHGHEASLCAVPSDAGWKPGSAFGYLPLRHAALNDALMTVHLRTVDPQDWFCVASTCPAIVGNVLVYRDASHVTQTFMRTIAPMLGPVVLAEGRNS